MARKDKTNFIFSLSESRRFKFFQEVINIFNVRVTLVVYERSKMKVQ